MTVSSYLTQALGVIVVLGFSGVFKECWTQEDITTPVILVHPVSRDVRSNESVTLTCLALGDDITYKWERENSVLPSQTLNQNTHVLTLPDLRPSDSGNYRCRVSNIHGVTFSNYAYVNVTGYLKAMVEPHNVTVEITTSVNLSCMANGYGVNNVIYAWEVSQIRAGAEASLSQLHNATSPHLLLNNVTTPAAYRCIATNSINSGTMATSAFSYITVVVHPPKIISHPISKHVELHNSNSRVNVSFSCAGVEDSSTHYQWEHLQGALPVNSLGEMTDTLTVYNIQPKDNGFYRCSISNNSGIAYSNYATLNVTVNPPNITAIYVNQSLYGVGDQAVFVCRGEGYGRLRFKWERQSGNIPSSALIDVNNGTLIIPMLSINDKGNYRCIVCDEWNGTVSSEYVQLNVTNKPLVINANPESMLAKEKSNVSFSCVVVDRHASATFLWSRVNGKPLSSRVHGSNHSVLSIVGVREEDEGEYTCTATTGNQTFTATIPLTVYGIPVIHQMRPEHVTELPATKIVLTCTAQNDQDSPHPLEMVWYKGENQLSSGQRYRISYIHASDNVIISILTISDVQKQDAGQYSCLIRPGDISTETMVVVKYKPEIISFQILPKNSVMLGETIQLLCQVDANPIASVTVYRNDMVIFSTTKKIVDYQIRVSADDDGTVFSCGAENSVGTVSPQHVTLSVVTGSTTSVTTTTTPYPAVVPANVEQTSRGLTSIQIQWTGLEEHTLFFHIKLYCVAPCADTVVRNFTSVDTSVTVHGLEPDHIYVVQVAALTNDGVLSGYSEPLQVSTATSDSVLFQLRLVSETVCNEWKTELDMMTATILNEITKHCACSLTAVDVFSDNISCDDNDHVIYRVGLSTSMELHAEEIHTVLNEWITQTSTLIVNGSLLLVDHTCPLILSSFNDPICSSTSAVPTDVDSKNFIPLLAVIIGFIVIGGVFIIILVIILMIKCRGKTDKIRPGGNTAVNGSLHRRPQRKSTGRKAQTNEEATYSEVFNNLPLCAIQSCPAYQASVHLDDHDYVDIEEENGDANIPTHVFASKAEPVKSHNEIEITSSSSSDRSNGNDYSEPLTLSRRLDSKASREVVMPHTSNDCSGYLKPVSHKNSNDDSGSGMDNQEMTQSQSTCHHHQKLEQMPSEYLEPVTAKDSQENINQQYDHLESKCTNTNIYSEIN